MVALPAYVGVLYDAIRERPVPAVNRTEMERGLAKQVLVNTRLVMNLPLSFDFATLEDAEAFLDWYCDEIKVVGEFTMPHPRSGKQITARFVSGDIGELRPVEGVERPWQCDVLIEYLR
ncbi:hypothetical protein, partial [Xanthomonas vesicatoria]|uniref:hypothetical protein n=1 Tax=Xanthomonas vesicatoria TaxID=56460 RepID=UPI0007322675